MGELELVGLHEDRRHLVLKTAEGELFSLPITEDVRRAIRRDWSPPQAQPRGDEPVKLPPKEIQARLRAGQSVEDVARDANMAQEHVERFAGPVIAEQEYILTRAKTSPLGAAGPRLEDLVAERLTAREVDPLAVTWSATRALGSPWTIQAAFDVNDAQRTARWTFTTSSRVLSPLDDEARWLSQPDTPLPGHSDVLDARMHGNLEDAAGTPPTTRPSDATSVLLDDLSHRRGVRSSTVPGDQSPHPPADDLFSGGPAHPTMAHPSTAHPSTAHPSTFSEPSHDADVVTLPRHRESQSKRRTDTKPMPVNTTAERPSDSSPATPARGIPHTGAAFFPVSVGPAPKPPKEPQTDDQRKGGKKARTKVPSLDDIVYGAKPRT